jgi:hypothetical protein
LVRPTVGLFSDSTGAARFFLSSSAKGTPTIISTRLDVQRPRDLRGQRRVGAVCEPASTAAGINLTWQNVETVTVSYLPIEVG